ncbi:MAG: hypothetical protein MZU95_11870 [Desulfomicrobium escambiense]|nr:hypothetical protein [Desulfomicrobium escambiense]
MLNLISRVTVCDCGSIVLEGHDVGRCKPYEVSDYGLARTFQEIHLFQGMSVIDNMKAACHLSGRYSLHRRAAEHPEEGEGGKADQRSPAWRCSPSSALISRCRQGREVASVRQAEAP